MGSVEVWELNDSRLEKQAEATVTNGRLVFQDL